MKKILSLFVTIALLMVSFTGCQNMAEVHIDPFEQPESEPKHTVKIPNFNKGDMTGDGSIELEFATGEEVSIYLREYKAAHKFVGVLFTDVNGSYAPLDIPFTLNYDEEFESFKVCFTMPDKDIILYKVIIESIPVEEKDSANYYVRNYYIKGNFKFMFLLDIGITDWIDSSELYEFCSGKGFSRIRYYYFLVKTDYKCPLSGPFRILLENTENTGNLYNTATLEKNTK